MKGTRKHLGRKSIKLKQSRKFRKSKMSRKMRRSNLKTRKTKRGGLFGYTCTKNSSDLDEGSSPSAWSKFKGWFSPKKEEEDEKQEAEREQTEEEEEESNNRNNK